MPPSTQSPLKIAAMSVMSMVSAILSLADCAKIELHLLCSLLHVHMAC